MSTKVKLYGIGIGIGIVAVLAVVAALTWGPTDSRGLTTAIYHYHAGLVLADRGSQADPASQYDRTSYTYILGQQLAGIGGAASDAKGQPTSSTAGQGGAAYTEQFTAG